MLPNLTELWNAYLAAEARGVRREFLAALDVFLHSWAACNPDVRVAWVTDFIKHWDESEEKPPIRGPLLEQVVVPHLTAEFWNGSAPAALQLAEVRGSSEGHRIWEQLDLPMVTELLTEAYRRNPSFEKARRKLLERHLYYIRYTLHELPSGVLWGIDGATAAECVELERLLDEVWQLVDESEAAEHKALLSIAQFHYRTYKEYLLQDDIYSYVEYIFSLVESGVEPPDPSVYLWDDDSFGC